MYRMEVSRRRVYQRRFFWLGSNMVSCCVLAV
jgi:hypothetical protein